MNYGIIDEVRALGWKHMQRAWNWLVLRHFVENEGCFEYADQSRALFYSTSDLLLLVGVGLASAVSRSLYAGFDGFKDAAAAAFILGCTWCSGEES